MQGSGNPTPTTKIGLPRRRRGRVSRPVQALPNLCHIDGAHGGRLIASPTLPAIYHPSRRGGNLPPVPALQICTMLMVHTTGASPTSLSSNLKIIKIRHIIRRIHFNRVILDIFPHSAIHSIISYNLVGKRFLPNGAFDLYRHPSFHMTNHHQNRRGGKPATNQTVYLPTIMV